MNNSQKLPLFLTQVQTCSYLEEESQSLCLVPQAPINASIFSVLSQQGFRRSGQFIYRPHCPACNACVPVRVPVASFTPNKQQQRVLKRGAQLTVTEHQPRFTYEYFKLYQRYIEQRHADGEMYPANIEQFQSFLSYPLPFARFFEFRLKQRLLAVAVTDVLDDGLSAVYSFFEPEEKYFSLGRYAILWQIAHAQQLGLTHLYLGYWIKDCAKMNYKTQYQPIEGFIDEQWQRL